MEHREKMARCDKLIEKCCFWNLYSEGSNDNFRLLSLRNKLFPQFLEQRRFTKILNSSRGAIEIDIECVTTTALP